MFKNVSWLIKPKDLDLVFLYRKDERVWSAKLSAFIDVGEAKEFRVFLQLVDAVLVADEVSVKEMQ